VNELVRELLALPPQASTVAPEIDLLHYTIIGVTMLGATLIAGAAVWFTIRYRTGRVGGAPGDPVPRRTVSLAVEFGLVAALAGFFVGAWVVGRRQYDVLREPPDDALEVWVVAKQWMWEFTYAEPHGLEHDLVVPAGRAVKLVLMSRDVIHSFYVPAFRVKMDAVPGRTTTVWFEASDRPHCGT